MTRYRSNLSQPRKRVIDRDSGFLVWFSLWVREVPGSVPGCPLQTFFFKKQPHLLRSTKYGMDDHRPCDIPAVTSLVTHYRSNLCQPRKRANNKYSGRVVWFSLRVQEVPGSIPGCPLQFFFRQSSCHIKKISTKYGMYHHRPCDIPAVTSLVTRYRSNLSQPRKRAIDRDSGLVVKSRLGC